MKGQVLAHPEMDVSSAATSNQNINLGKWKSVPAPEAGSYFGTALHSLVTPSLPPQAPAPLNT